MNLLDIVVQLLKERRKKRNSHEKSVFFGFTTLFYSLFLKMPPKQRSPDEELRHAAEQPSTLPTFNLHHPVAISRILSFACRTGYSVWNYSQVTSSWRETVEPGPYGGIGAKIWIDLKIEEVKFIKGMEIFSDSESAENFTSLAFFSISKLPNEFKIFAKHAELNGFNNLVSIANSFQEGNSVMIHLDLSALTNIESIGERFCVKCTHLKSIQFSSDMSKVKKLDESFLEQCSSLQSLDLSAFTNLEEIEESFCYCSNLEKIEFPKQVPNLKKIGGYFLAECSALFTPFCCLEEIGESFLYECSSLTSMDLSSCVKTLAKIGDFFIARGSSLKSINFGSEEDNENHLLTTLSNHFLSNCESLETVDLSMFKKVTSIEIYFLYRCDNLRELDLSKGFGKDLAGIGAVFLGKSRVQSFPVTIVIDEKNRDRMTTMIGDAHQVPCSVSISFPNISFKSV
jgi:hypothetical protein